MSVGVILSVRTYSLLLCVVHLYIKGVLCSECTDLARIQNAQVVSPCQPTASHATGRGVVFDFYGSNTLAEDSCSCSIAIQSTTRFKLSMSAYEGLGIDITSGCGSRIEVNSSSSGSLIMECRVFGSIAMKAGESAAVTLFKEQNGDARYCMLMSTDQSFIMDINCEAVGSPPTTTTTTTPTPTTTTTTTTTPKPTITKPTTTTTKPTTTTTKPTTTTTKPTTTTTTPTPTTTTTTTTTPKPTTTKTTTTTTKPTTTTTKPTTTTTKLETTTTKPETTTTKPETTTSKTPPTTTYPIPTTTKTTTMTTKLTTTTTAAEDGTDVGGQDEDSDKDNLIIIIPVVVGVFLLLLLLVVVKQLVRTKKKQRKEPDMEKLKFGYTFPKHSVFLNSTGMVETTKYNSQEDLHGYNDRYLGVTNPVYMHEEAVHQPDTTDEQITEFTSTHNTESDKIISELTLDGSEVSSEAPLYAVVNKRNTDISLDFTKMSDYSSNSSSEINSIGMMDENERNLRHEETFHY